MLKRTSAWSSSAHSSWSCSRAHRSRRLSARTIRVVPTIEQDLALALELADIADSITIKHHGASDLVIETKPDLTPVTEADRAVELALRERIAAARPSDAVLGEEYGVSERAGPPALDHRPDRRHQELHPRDVDLVDADRARGRRRNRGRGGRDAGARAPVVGVSRRGRVCRRASDPRFGDRLAGRGAARVERDPGMGRGGSTRSADRAGASVLADPWRRGRLAVHAGRRGRSRDRARPERVAVGPRGGQGDRRGGRRAVHGPGAASPPPTAAAGSRATALCTTRRWHSSEPDSPHDAAR